MNTALMMPLIVAAMVWLPIATALGADSKPYVGGHFQGRIACSCDGNHNDPDDWIASPLALTILAEAGLRDRLVHFDYNSILPQTNSDWEKTHAESVLGAAERYGFEQSIFHDCHRDPDAAIASIAGAINASSAGNPLYLIIAGPMEVPCLGIQRADAARRPFVHCISHSRWNDGFASRYRFTFTKRSVIEQGVHWVQISDQNRLLSFGQYGRPAAPGEFEPYFWLRDSTDPNLRWLWERMLLSTRPDPSDAGMAWFLVTGDETCDPAKLKQLLEDHRTPAIVAARQHVRIEAENFRHLEGFVLEDRNDRQASHRLNVRLDRESPGRIRTCFDEPFAPAEMRCDLEVRYLDEPGQQPRFTTLVNGVAQGAPWQSTGTGRGWVSQVIGGVVIRTADELMVEASGGLARVDYVQLNRTDR